MAGAVIAEIRPNQHINLLKTHYNYGKCINKPGYCWQAQS